MLTKSWFSIKTNVTATEIFGKEQHLMEQRFGGSDPEWSREPTDEERRAMLEKGAVDMEYFESGKGEEDLTAIHEAVLQTDPELSRQVADRLMSGRDPR